ARRHACARLRALRRADPPRCGSALRRNFTCSATSGCSRVTRLCGTRSSRSPPPRRSKTARRPPPADQLSLFVCDVASERPPTRKPWAWLLKHVFQADLQTCPRCVGPMRWLEAATTPGAIARLLAKHGLAPQPPPARSAVPPGQLALSFGP